MKYLLLLTMLLSGCLAEGPYTPDEEEFLKQCSAHVLMKKCKNRLYHVRVYHKAGYLSGATKAVLCSPEAPSQ